MGATLRTTTDPAVLRHGLVDGLDRLDLRRDGTLEASAVRSFLAQGREPLEGVLSAAEAHVLAGLTQGRPGEVGDCYRLLRPATACL